jgi:putative ABC transport system permease protein
MTQTAQRQVHLPLRKAVRIAWRGIRIRWFRSLLVTSGIILALAFLAYVLSSDAVAGSIARQFPQRMGQVQADRVQAVGQLRQALETAPLPVTVPDNLTPKQLAQLRDDLERGALLGGLGPQRLADLNAALATAVRDWRQAANGQDRQNALQGLQTALQDAGLWEEQAFSAVRKVVKDGQLPAADVAHLLSLGQALAPALAAMSESARANVLDALDRAGPYVNRAEAYADASNALANAGLLKQASADDRTQTYWILGLALLISFVGILNAMLMSVTERFAEIGTMKCLGALDGFVIKLFMLESTFQGLGGAIIGVVLGVFLAVLEGLVRFGIGRYGEFASVWSEVTWTLAMVPWMTLVTVVAICVVAGTLLTIVAAMYPAWRAARMQPVDAMRAEV